MNNNFKILIILNQLLTTCGVSKHLYYFLSEAKKYTEFNFTIVCGGGDAIEKYKDLCSEIIIYPEVQHENRSILKYLKSVFFLLKLQSQNHFDLIHTHTHYAANLAKYVSKIYNIKTLQTVHGILEPVGRLNHYPSKFFISVNEHISDFLTQQKKIRKENIYLIRNGIMANDNLFSKDNLKLKVIAAGRLVKEKGFQTYIKAISLLDSVTKQKAEFYLAGKGEEIDNLRKLAESLNVPVNFIGEIKNIENILSESHILVNPSESKFEGFPIIIVEAAFKRNLIVSSDFGGHNSVLRKDINSLIYEQKNVNELAMKLDYGINKYHNLTSMIENLFKDVKEKFNLNKTTDQILKLYKKIIVK